MALSEEQVFRLGQFHLPREEWRVLFVGVSGQRSCVRCPFCGKTINRNLRSLNSYALVNHYSNVHRHEWRAVARLAEQMGYKKVVRTCPSYNPCDGIDADGLMTACSEMSRVEWRTRFLGSPTSKAELVCPLCQNVVNKARVRTQVVALKDHYSKVHRKIWGEIAEIARSRGFYRKPIRRPDEVVEKNLETATDTPQQDALHSVKEEFDPLMGPECSREEGLECEPSPGNFYEDSDESDVNCEAMEFFNEDEHSNSEGEERRAERFLRIVTEMQWLEENTNEIKEHQQEDANQLRRRLEETNERFRRFLTWTEHELLTES